MHTKGPWKSDPTISMHDRPDLPCVVDADGLIVAQCWDDGHSEDECEANARLIAAAPDLYEALSPVLRGAGEADYYCPDDVADDHTVLVSFTIAELRAARAALSKASQQQGSPQDDSALERTVLAATRLSRASGERRKEVLDRLAQSSQEILGDDC